MSFVCIFLLKELFRFCSWWFLIRLNMPALEILHSYWLRTFFSVDLRSDGFDFEWICLENTYINIGSNVKRYSYIRNRFHFFFYFYTFMQNTWTQQSHTLKQKAKWRMARSRDVANAFNLIFSTQFQKGMRYSVCLWVCKRERDRCFFNALIRGCCHTTRAFWITTMKKCSKICKALCLAWRWSLRCAL